MASRKKGLKLSVLDADMKRDPTFLSVVGELKADLVQPVKKRGRPPRLSHAKNLSQAKLLEVLADDATPAYVLATRLRNDPASLGRERYRRALREVAAEWNLSERTLERRARQYRKLIEFDSRITAEELSRLSNFIKSQIAAGRADEDVVIPANLIPRKHRR